MLFHRVEVAQHLHELKHVMGTMWEMEEMGIIALPDHHIDGFVRLA